MYLNPGSDSILKKETKKSHGCLDRHCHGDHAPGDVHSPVAHD